MTGFNLQQAAQRRLRKTVPPGPIQPGRRSKTPTGRITPVPPNRVPTGPITSTPRGKNPGRGGQVLSSRPR